jgi:hypothetical protein
VSGTETMDEALTRVTFHGRRAAQLENEYLRITVLEEGGHIAEVFDKRAQISPLWIPHWTSLEPSAFDANAAKIFGTGSDAKLLAGIMGHNLCLDLFGGPSQEEEAAGLTAHGEASLNLYGISGTASQLRMELPMPMAQLKLIRVIQLHGEHILIRETVENMSSTDRPIAWTQHVTLSPPFLDPATTEFRASLTRSIVAETDPGLDEYHIPGREFDWPLAPHQDGSHVDLRKMHQSAPASGYTAHVVDSKREHAYFVAYAPSHKLAFGYVWKSADFPWLGIWEENCSRQTSPWDGHTITRGMEFGVSPFPESRRAMIERNRLLDTPTYRWISARGKLEVEYWITSRITDEVPETMAWPQAT